MITLNNVQILGKVTLPPRLRKLDNGKQVAELGLGIPESFRKENGEWSSRMHFVDVVLWEDQAAYAEKKLRKGDGALVQGSLQYDQWDGKDGKKHNKLRVRGVRVQNVPLPAARDPQEAED